MTNYNLLVWLWSTSQMLLFSWTDHWSWLRVPIVWSPAQWTGLRMATGSHAGVMPREDRATTGAVHFTQWWAGIFILSTHWNPSHYLGLRKPGKSRMSTILEWPRVWDWGKLGKGGGGGGGGGRGIWRKNTSPSPFPYHLSQSQWQRMNLSSTNPSKMPVL